MTETRALSAMLRDCFVFLLPTDYSLSGRTQFSLVRTIFQHLARLSFFFLCLAFTMCFRILGALGALPRKHRASVPV